MPELLELQKDKSFRLKLILICLSVALSVSTIYVVVSYRLSADLGLQTELDSLHNQARLLQGQLLLSNQNPKDSNEQLAKLVELVYFNDHQHTSEFYLNITAPNLKWSITHEINTTQLDYLQAKLSTHQNEFTPNNDIASGSETLDGKQFIWLMIHGDHHQIIIIKTSEHVSNILSMVMKRLIITSVIVFWLATWFALTLSSWMNKRVQDKNDALAHLATHDSLTGLPNRLFLTNMMQNVISSSKEPLTVSSHVNTRTLEQGSLFVVDLDKFKDVNSAFGHSAGDTLLIKVAHKLRQALEEEQKLIRVGGDEFIIWAPEMSVHDSRFLAQKLTHICNEPVMVNNLSVSTSASIGLSHYPTHALEPESLILYAHSAMHEAKEKRCGWSMFNEQNRECGRQRLKLRADLDNALSEQQIQLHYQPKVSLEDGSIIGVEGLSRWYHPNDGLLSPAHFIDVIEQSGRVQEFGRYVILMAIEQLSIWHQKGIFTPIAINLSPYNLLDPSLLDFTVSELRANDIEPNKLEIELVESSTSINIDEISSRLSDFKQAGIKLAIDDFGTGMSSLSYISNLNVHNIKIDRSFIDGIEHDTKKQAVITTAIVLAKSFGSKAIAEGIENKAQADLLLKMGCLYGQGYYYAQPMAADSIDPLLEKKATLPM